MARRQGAGADAGEIGITMTTIEQRIRDKIYGFDAATGARPTALYLGYYEDLELREVLQGLQLFRTLGAIAHRTAP